MDVFEAIENRRSIRKYKPDAVSDDIVDRVIEAARLAPSWANCQCWRFVVVRDAAVRERLANTLFGITDRPNRTAEAIKVAPVTIALCAELGKSGIAYREPREPVTDKGEYWYMFDTALAMENLVLAAQSLGLGTVIVGAFDSREAGKLLGVGEGFTVVALTPLGFPDESPKARPRKELHEIICRDSFSST